MTKVARFNLVTFFLMFFIALICFAFYYFYKISDDIQNYDENRDVISSLELLNKEIDDSTSFFNQLSNYDLANKNIDKFERFLKKIQMNILMHYPQSKKLHHFLEDIDNSFAFKVQSVERFKSLNASLISGSAFLFDLQRNIDDAQNISYKIKSFVNEAMFYLFEFSNSQHIRKTFIEKKIEQLDSVVANNDNQLLQNFSRQSKVLLSTIVSLSKVSQEVQDNKLTEQLELLHNVLDEQYDSNIHQEKIIVIFLFVLMVIVWFIFIVMYVRFLKNQMVLQQHALVFENTQETIVITNPQGRAVSINRAFSDIYGYEPHEVIGKKFNILHSGMHDEIFYKDMWSQIIHNGIFQGRVVNKTKDGKNIPMWITIKAVYDKSGEVVNYIGVQTDLRALEASKSKAEYLAYHDTLTGLYNRVSFEELLERSLITSQRDKTKFAVLFIDLDRFKIINDTLGHDIGDRVLVETTKRLEVILRKSDVISRWGGDEFVVILHNVTSESLIATIAQKIIKGIKKPITIDNHNLSVTASVGIALYPEDAKDTQTLIRYVDSAMYRAKESGKNSFCFYTSALSDKVQERLQIDLQLQNALEKNEIYMVFQPQYSLENNKIVSAEALVRWESDKLGLVPPDKFIPIAEENGFIVPLGYFIFEESCKKYKQMKEAGVALERIAINVSTIQFKQVNLVSEFLSILSRYNLQASEIEIEITERFIMDNTENNIKILQEFREQGFAISIDDFGTGYSSISYLKRLPIDTLKIDKAFVDDIGLGNRLDDAIVDAIVALSKTLHYMIVAEGIETKEQEDFLGNCGCNIGQGYFFSKPLKVEDIIKNYRN